MPHNIPTILVKGENCGDDCPGTRCKLVRTGYGDDFWVKPPEGFIASRKHCKCLNATTFLDGSCSCSPGDLSSPIVLRRKDG